MANHDKPSFHQKDYFPANLNVLVCLILLSTYIPSTGASLVCVLFKARKPVKSAYTSLFPDFQTFPVVTETFLRP